MSFELRLYGTTDPPDAWYIDVHINERIWALSVYRNRKPVLERVQ